MPAVVAENPPEFRELVLSSLAARANSPRATLFLTGGNGIALWAIGRFPESEAALAEFLEMASTLPGLVFEASSVRWIRSTVLFFLGRFDELRRMQDDTLRDIYARETASHVATVRDYLARESQLAEPHALPEEVYRACHTLSGSSKMAQARHGIRLAEVVRRP